MNVFIIILIAIVVLLFLLVAGTIIKGFNEVIKSNQEVYNVLKRIEDKMD
ncbi:hypothetical protein [Roseivirga sp.]